MNYHLLHTEELIRRARVTPLGNLSPVDWQMLAGALATRLEKTLTPEAVEGELVARYGGNGSHVYWARVNALPEELRWQAYSEGVILQNVEGHVLRMLGIYEQDARNGLPATPSRPAEPDRAWWSEAKPEPTQPEDAAEPAPDSPVEVGEVLANIRADLSCYGRIADCKHRLVADLIESLTKQLEGHEGAWAQALPRISKEPDGRFIVAMVVRQDLAPELHAILARLKAKGEK